MWKSLFQQDPRQGSGLCHQYGSFGQFSRPPHPPGIGSRASPFPPSSYSTEHLSETETFPGFLCWPHSLLHIGSVTGSGFVSSFPGNRDCFQVVVFCMAVEARGGGASLSPRGRVADGEASPRRARTCHSKDLRKLSPLSSRHFPFSLLSSYTSW